MYKKLLITFLFSVLLINTAFSSNERVILTYKINPKLDKGTLYTIYQLTIDKLSNYHTVLTSDKLSKGFENEAELKKELKNTEAKKVFIIEALNLGTKYILTLKECEVPSLGVNHSATLTSNKIEEADLIIPRLVKAVINRQPVSKTQEVDTITKNEAREHQKLHGEFLWGLTILGSFIDEETKAGGGIKIIYETKFLRLGSDLLGGGGFGNFNINLALMFPPENISLYLGGGLGYVVRGGYGYITRGGIGGTLFLGVEAFRFYETRLMFDINLLLPFFKNEIGSDFENYLYASDVIREEEWAPLVYMGLSLVF